ncbi:MAG: hypothetical protein COB09_18670 [Thalassobium sp.]|nr:MAG: hypothetical protein COB09_18670 [Thalassobium sp.]
MSQRREILVPMKKPTKKFKANYKQQLDDGIFEKIGDLHYKKVFGKVAIFNIDAPKVVKFFLQENDNEEVFLLHFASGAKICSLTPTKLKYCRSYVSMKDRTAAKLAIFDIINRVGLEKVLQQFDSLPVVNT